jgi:hypothetical protein
VIDFEQPLERNRLWLNPLDAEQNYGVVAMRPGARDSALTIDGDGAEWGARGVLYAGSAPAALPAPLQLRGLRVLHDPGYVYLRLDVGRVDWNRAHYLVGISTLGDSLGDARLPYTGARSPAGLEFVLDLRGPAGSRLLVDSPYNLYRRVPIVGSRPAATMQIYTDRSAASPNADGRYDSLFVVTNRRRIGRDGTVFPEQGYDRNLLVHARQQETTLADWYADTARGAIEVRIPWGMLHVLDPSGRSVLQAAPGSREIEGVETPGFRFVVQSYDPARPTAGGDRLPPRRGRRLRRAPALELAQVGGAALARRAQAALRRNARDLPGDSRRPRGPRSARR